MFRTKTQLLRDKVETLMNQGKNSDALKIAENSRFLVDNIIQWDVLISSILLKLNKINEMREYIDGILKKNIADILVYGNRKFFSLLAVFNEKFCKLKGIKEDSTEYFKFLYEKTPMSFRVEFISSHWVKAVKENGEEDYKILHEKWEKEIMPVLEQLEEMNPLLCVSVLEMAVTVNSKVGDYKLQNQLYELISMIKNEQNF
jgi:hypothetical protein